VRDDCLDNVGSSTSHNPMGFHGLLRRWLYFLHVDVRTSQERHIWAYTAWYRDSFASSSYGFFASEWMGQGSAGICRPSFGALYQPQSTDGDNGDNEDECVAVAGRTSRKSAAVPICPP
jgi:hypothetical protein